MPGKPLEAPFEGFKDFACSILEEWRVPGAGVAVVRNGEALLCQGFGVLDHKDSQRVDADTLFGIASVTKSFTSAGLALLVSRGLLDWDQPVRRYLPAFRLYDPFSSANITPRDLVCHRSGLPAHDWLWYGSRLSMDEIVSRLDTIQPNRNLRSAYQYQNLLFMAAGAILEKVSGERWQDFVQREFFDPLRMARSNFSVRDSQTDANAAQPHLLLNEAVTQIPFLDVDALGPAGSINSTAADLARWLTLHMNEGCWRGEQIVPAARVRETHTPQTIIDDNFRKLNKFPELGEAAYGMGWFIQGYRGRRMVYHSGSIDGFASLISFLPDENVGVVALTNLDSQDCPFILSFNLYDRLLGLEPLLWNERFKAERAAAKRAAERANDQAAGWRTQGTTPSHPLKDYAGTYEHSGYGSLSVSIEDGRLKAFFNGFHFKMEHYHYDVFKMENEDAGLNMKVQFFMDLHGLIDRLSLALEPNVADIVFARSQEAPKYQAGFLQHMTGEYELNGRLLTIELHPGGGLSLAIPGQPVARLVPYRGQAFKTSTFPVRYVVFQFDEQGKTVAFDITLPDGLVTAYKQL